MDNVVKSRSASAAILYQLSEQGRLVLSDWKAMLFLRSAAFSLEPSRRRWTTVPAEPKEAWPILRRMLTRGEIAQISPVRGVRHLYRASVPYARER